MSAQFAQAMRVATIDSRASWLTRKGKKEANAPPALSTAARAAPCPIFPFPPWGMERREAPGGLRDPLGGPCDRPAGTLARRSALLVKRAAPPGAPPVRRMPHEASCKPITRNIVIVRERCQAAGFLRHSAEERQDDHKKRNRWNSTDRVCAASHSQPLAPALARASNPNRNGDRGRLVSGRVREQPPAQLTNKTFRRRLSAGNAAT
jgi:hypothetical protein